MPVEEKEEEASDLRLVEDEHTGALRLVNRSSARGSNVKRARADEEDSASIRRGVIRFLVIVIDCSDVMNSRDMRPTRLSVVSQVVFTLLQNFFDQNPISQVALVELRDGKADKITELSANARHHKSRLEERLAQCNDSGKGAASLREVLVVYGALNSVDRGDVYETVGKLKDRGVKVNIVGMAAEVFLCQNICEETGGTYKVATTAAGLKELVLAHTKPAAVLAEAPDGTKIARKPATGMWVGFPERRQHPLPGWQCPRCHSLHSDLPVDCSLCGLKLLSSSHLARSYHHLFPVPHFDEEHDEEEPDPQGQQQDGQGANDDNAAAQRAPWNCFGCGVAVLPGQGQGRHVCPGCNNSFCVMCDGFIHETLHVCPGCGGMQQDADRAGKDKANME